MKKTLMAGLLASVAMTSAAMACEVTLRSSDTHPDGYPTVAAVEHMGNLIKERTGGRICVEIFHSAQLGQEADTIEQTRFGVIDLNRVSMGPFNNLIEQTKVVSLPFIFNDTSHMHRVMDGPIGDEILAAFEDHGFIGLAYFDGGSRSFYNRTRPINSFADMAGLKIRVIQSDVFVDMMSAMGASATPMPFGEVFSAIQTGVIDGAENNWPSYESTGHYEVAQHYTLTEHLIVPEVLVMSKIAWDKLSADDQAIIRQAARETIPVNRELWAARSAASEEKVRAAGVAVVDQIDKKPFQDAMGPVYEKHAGSPALQELVARIRATE
jgi:tripartite ATP-independent transporter DctP family solute receptor